MSGGPRIRKNTAYRLGFGRKKRSSANKVNNSFAKTLLIDYGSFTGAIIGAVGTIAAGAAAWIGVQDQVYYQRYANDLSELVSLQSETDRLYNKIQILNKMKDFSDAMNWDIMQIHTGEEIAVKRITEWVGKFVSNQSKTIDLIGPEIVKGVAGPLGLELMNRYNACKSAASEKGQGAPIQIKLFKGDSNYGEFYSREPEINVPDIGASSADEAYVFDFNYRIAYLLNECLKDAANFRNKIKVLEETTMKQIKNIDTRISVVRSRYSN